MSETASSSALPAFIRGMRTLLVVQVVVAAIALGATVWATVKLPGLTQRAADLSRQIEAKSAEIGVLETRSAAMNAQLARTAEASRYLTQGLVIGARGNWAEAIPLLAQAQATDPENPLFLRELAEAEYRDRRFTEAVAHIAEARRKSGEQVVLDDFTRQATYQCAAGQVDRAEATLRDPAFLPSARANQALVLNNVALLSACPQASHPYFRQLVGTLQDGGPAADATAFKIERVFLHIVRPSDRDNARLIREDLRAAGYNVPAIQQVDPDRFAANVRYYYGAQATEAGEIAALVQRAAAERGIGAWDDAALAPVSLEGRYQGLPTNTVEVWLPPGD